MKYKLLVMDVDGTLTDGKIYMGENGEICKAFSIKDGFGIHDLLIPAGIVPIVITGRKTKIVENRCKELGITEVHQGVRDKYNKLFEIVDNKGLSLNEVAYIGDDENDILCMKAVKEKGGLVGCPADAIREVKEIADFVAEENGGEGAVREMITYILDL